MSTANPTMIVPGSNSIFRTERRVTKSFHSRTIQLFAGFRGGKILQGQKMCRIHHFPGEEQVSPKNGQRDPESMRFLII